MNDVERIIEASNQGDLILPSTKTPSIVDLSNAVGSIAGIKGLTGSSNVQKLIDMIGSNDHLVLVIVDGLGMNVVQEAGNSNSLFSNTAMELVTVFPSTTSTVLTSYATGLWPSQHGVPNWHLYIKEIDTISTIIRFNRRYDQMDLSTLGITPRQAYPAESMISKFDRTTLGVIPELIADTAYSTYWRGHSPCETYKTFEEAVNIVSNHLNRAIDSTFTHLYYSEVDTLSHQNGIDHDLVKLEIKKIDFHISHLLDKLPPRSTVIVSADHGLKNSGPQNIIRLESSDDLLNCLDREPWGTGRAVNFAVTKDMSDEFETRFRERFGDHFYLLSSSEILELNLLGQNPVSDITKSRIGNYWAISKGASVIDYRYPTAVPKTHVDQASHGGLSQDEMMVPLILMRT